MAVPHHFSIVVLDVEGSGELTGPEKELVRRDLYAILSRALELSGVGAASVRKEDRGDGVYLLISADVSKRLLIDPFIAALDDELGERPVGQPGLRLRLVVHHGEVLLDEQGSSGGAVDTAFAMVDSPQLREALRSAKRGRIAVVVPDDLYLSVVRGYPRPDPQRFRMRQLETKRGRLRTWVTVLGATEQPGSSAGDASTSELHVSHPQPSMHVGDNNSVGTNAGGFVGRSSGTVTFGAASRDPGGDR
ncbi:hypothetical protein AB0C12_37695 [Actinoplanes sp. NPDC048967]|uniref:hypothetical protein n=1 Tax=Actinoplanes sp. NPDC048967 TaxID=3155269 RepID=UPI0033F8BA92